MQILTSMRISGKMLFYISVLMPLCAMASTQSEKSSLSTVSTGEVVKHIRKVFGSAPALVEVAGVCKPHSEVIEIPRFEWNRIVDMGDGSASGDPVSYNNKVIEMRRENGVVVIKWPGLSSHLLNLKIANFYLSNSDRYSVVDAVEYLLNRGEVKRVMLGLKMRPMLELSGTVSLPSPGKPHLPDSMNNASFEGILKSVVREFNGIFFYKECSLPDGQRRMDFKFYHPGSPLH